MKNKKILFISCIFIVGIIGFVLGDRLALYQRIIQPEIIEDIDIPIRDKHVLSHFEACLIGERPTLKPIHDLRDKFYVILEALSQRNEKACLRLEETAIKNECLRYFYSVNALLTNNQEYCEKLGNLMQDIDWQKRCFAILKNEVSLCKEIQDLFKKEVCKAIILGPEHCDRLSGYYKIPITHTESIEGAMTTRIEIKEIGEEEAKSFCRREAYLIRAIQNQDLAMCERIGMKQHIIMPTCRILSSPNPKKEFNKYHQDFCYEKFAFEIARIKNEPLICEKIPAKEARNLTYYQECLAQFR